MFHLKQTAILDWPVKKNGNRTTHADQNRLETILDSFLKIIIIFYSYYSYTHIDSVFLKSLRAHVFSIMKL